MKKEPGEDLHFPYVLICFFLWDGVGQEHNKQSDTEQLYHAHMKKYRVQKRFGVPVAIAGGAAVAAGAIITALSPLGGLTEGGDTEPVDQRVLNGLMIGGGAVLAAGIGLLVSSKKHYRKAFKIAPVLGMLWPYNHRYRQTVEMRIHF